MPKGLAGALLRAWRLRAKLLIAREANVPQASALTRCNRLVSNIPRTGLTGHLDGN